jgi:hypothetical protein
MATNSPELSGVVEVTRRRESGEKVPPYLQLPYLCRTRSRGIRQGDRHHLPVPQLKGLGSTSRWPALALATARKRRPQLLSCQRRLYRPRVLTGEAFQFGSSGAPEQRLV